MYITVALTCFLYMIGNSIEDSIKGTLLYLFWGQLLFPLLALINLVTKNNTQCFLNCVCTLLMPAFMWVYSEMYHCVGDNQKFIFLLFIMTIVSFVHFVFSIGAQQADKDAKR